MWRFTNETETTLTKVIMNGAFMALSTYLGVLHNIIIFSLSSGVCPQACSYYAGLALLKIAGESE